MDLQQKLDMYKELRKKSSIEGEVTLESVTSQVKKDFDTALGLAKNFNMKIHDAADAFPDTVKAGMFNTDVLATLGEIHDGRETNEPNDKSLYEYIIRGLIVPVINATILLEVCDGRDFGDDSTFDFTVKHCYYLDSSAKLNEVAALTYKFMTGDN